MISFDSVKKITITYSLMIEHLFDTIIATSTEKEWYYLTIKVHDFVLNMLETVTVGHFIKTCIEQIHVVSFNCRERYEDMLKKRM